jgi:ABC-type transporter Mla MlaB component
MLHITQLTTGAPEQHLQLEGDLDKEHVEALQQATGVVMPSECARFVLHCGQLRRVDDCGLRLLGRLRRNGARLVDVPFQIDWKLAQLDYRNRSHA